jgi:hypothetical protein
MAAVMLDRVATRYGTRPSLILRDEAWALDFDWAIAQVGAWAQTKFDETEWTGKGKNRKPKPKYKPGEVFRMLDRAAAEVFETRAAKTAAPPTRQYANFDELAALAKLQG